MPKVTDDELFATFRDNENYGTSIFREGGSIVIAIGARRGHAHCAYMNLYQAREMAEALLAFAGEIERGEPG
jgi:hypothetical protein